MRMTYYAFKLNLLTKAVEPREILESIRKALEPLNEAILNHPLIKDAEEGDYP